MPARHTHSCPLQHEELVKDNTGGVTDVRGFSEAFLATKDSHSVNEVIMQSTLSDRGTLS